VIERDKGGGGVRTAAAQPPAMGIRLSSFNFYATLMASRLLEQNRGAQAQVLRGRHSGEAAAAA